MKVITYKANLTERDDAHEQGLLDRWAKSWQAHGWEPEVVGPAEAESHPDYSWLSMGFAAQPTVNRKDYEQACWIRWLAYRRFNEPVVIADYDVRNCGWLPPERVPIAASLDPDALSSCVLASPRFLAAIPYLLLTAAQHSGTTIEGRPHNSDMFGWKWLAWHHARTFEIWPVVVGYPSAGPLVHYAGQFTGSIGLTKVQAWDKD